MRAVIIGEGMLELSGGADIGAAGWRLGYGGDTLNTALHMVRSGADVAYATALGTDAFSEDLLSAWASDGLDVSMVLRDPSRMPGLYAIRTDASGERSFSYWRSDSAARRFFALPDAAMLFPRAMAADLFYFSLISLAVLPDEGRHVLIDVARRLRTAGRTVAFDGNYRHAWGAERAEAGGERGGGRGGARMRLAAAGGGCGRSAGGRGEDGGGRMSAHRRRSGCARHIAGTRGHQRGGGCIQRGVSARADGGRGAGGRGVGRSSAGGMGDSAARRGAGSRCGRALSRRRIRHQGRPPE